MLLFHVCFPILTCLRQKHLFVCFINVYGCWFRIQQALPRDAAMEDITIRNHYLEERLLSLESQLSKEPLSRPSVSACPFSYNNVLSLISLMAAYKFHSSSQLFFPKL